MYRLYPTFAKSLITRWNQRSLNIRGWKSFPDVEVKSVAIVGNAGYLAELEQGTLIDAHDLVIRMNNFQISGFEAQVGSRTDLFMTNFFTDIDFQRPELRSVKQIIASVPNNFRKHRRHSIHHRHAEHIVAGMRALRRKDVFVPEWSMFYEWIRTWGSFPSTGMMAVLFALEFLAFEKLYLTGFSFFQGPSHYFPDRPASARNHDFDQERNCIHSLLKPHLQANRIVMDPIMRDSLNFSLAVPVDQIPQPITQ